MSTILRTEWSLSDINALPEGEHDYFDRKSGRLLEKSDFRVDLAKAISAFANSGGGHILLGVEDDGTFDGVPRTKGRTCIREWIEQIIPSVVEPVPTAFRVHLVESTSEISIDDDRVVIVLDLDDSYLAPFQSRSTKLYYHRVGGHSVPASHFYLESLRNRIRVPSLSVAIVGARIMRVLETENVFFVQLLMTLAVTNDGNVTPAYWHVDFFDRGERIATAGQIRRFGFPIPTMSFQDGNHVHEDRVLPGQTRRIVDMLGIYIDRNVHKGDFPKLVVEILKGCKLAAAVVSESHVGQTQEIDISRIFDAVDESSIHFHTPKLDRKRHVGPIGAGIYLKQFQMEEFDAPDEHVNFCGLIENTSDKSFKELHLVVVFFDKNDNVTGYRQTDVGRLPPKSERHWKDWILAAEIWNSVRMDAFYYDHAWLKPYLQFDGT